MTMMIFVWTWIAWAVLLNVACFDVYDESNKLIRVENFYPPSGYQPVQGFEPPNYKPYKKIYENPSLLDQIMPGSHKRNEFMSLPRPEIAQDEIKNTQRHNIEVPIIRYPIKQRLDAASINEHPILSLLKNADRHFDLREPFSINVEISYEPDGELGSNQSPVLPPHLSPSYNLPEQNNHHKNHVNQAPVDYPAPPASETNEFRHDYNNNNQFKPSQNQDYYYEKPRPFEANFEHENNNKPNSVWSPPTTKRPDAGWRRTPPPKFIWTNEYNNWENQPSPSVYHQSTTRAYWTPPQAPVTPSTYTPHNYWQSQTPSTRVPDGHWQPQASSTRIPDGYWQSQTPSTRTPDSFWQSPSTRMPNGYWQSQTPSTRAPDGHWRPESPSTRVPDGYWQSQILSTRAPPDGYWQSQKPSTRMPENYWRPSSETHPTQNYWTQPSSSSTQRPPYYQSTQAYNQWTSPSTPQPYYPSNYWTQPTLQPAVVTTPSTPAPAQQQQEPDYRELFKHQKQNNMTATNNNNIYNPSYTVNDPIELVIHRECMKCLCFIESWCSDVGCVMDEGSLSCGWYQLKYEYWVDCGQPGGGWKECANNKKCAEGCVMAYMKRYRSFCSIGQTCADLARIHNGGLYGCSANSTEYYGWLIGRCLRRESPYQHIDSHKIPD